MTLGPSFIPVQAAEEATTERDDIYIHIRTQSRWFLKATLDGSEVRIC